MFGPWCWPLLASLRWIWMRWVNKSLHTILSNVHTRKKHDFGNLNQGIKMNNCLKNAYIPIVILNEVHFHTSASSCRVVFLPDMITKNSVYTWGIRGRRGVRDKAIFSSLHWERKKKIIITISEKYNTYPRQREEHRECHYKGYTPDLQLNWTELGRRHITGRTKNKLPGKSDVAFGVPSVAFPGNLYIVLPNMCRLEQNDLVPYAPSPGTSNFQTSLTAKILPQQLQNIMVHHLSTPLIMALMEYFYYCTRETDLFGSKCFSQRQWFEPGPLRCKVNTLASSQRVPHSLRPCKSYTRFF